MSETVPPNTPKLTPGAVYTAYKEDQKKGPLAHPLFLARIIAIAVACVGAIPTGYNLYWSWKAGIPYNEVSHRLEQYQLWEKNFECKIDYRTVMAGSGTKVQGTRVDVGACPTSGDIALKVTTAAGKSSYQWIAFDKLNQASQSASLLSLFVDTAQAQEARPGEAKPEGAGPGAGGGMQVHCEARAPRDKIVRIVAEGAKCFREHISPMLGRMESREEVPCNTTCTATK